MQQVGSHGAGGSLAMRTCHAQTFAAAGDDAQYLGALIYVETVFTEIGQFCMLLRHGGGIDHERACLVFAHLRNKVDILFVVYLYSFRNQAFCQFARRTVVARYFLSFREE